VNQKVHIDLFRLKRGSFFLYIRNQPIKRLTAYLRVLVPYDDLGNSPLFPVQLSVLLLHPLNLLSVPNRHEGVMDSQSGVLAN
jgi:hypothetical protein